jgi:hypothetical protein
MNKLSPIYAVWITRDHFYKFFLLFLFISIPSIVFSQMSDVGCQYSCETSLTVELDNTGNATITTDDVIVDYDIVGYIMEENVTNNFIDTISTVNQLFSQYEVSFNINIGFNFPFWESNYVIARMAASGFVQIGSGLTSPFPIPETLPNGSGRHNIIAGATQYLGVNPTPGYNAGTGQAFHRLIGTAPNRISVFWWDSPKHVNTNSDRVDLQIHLHESTGIIEVHVKEQPNSSLNHTLGINNADGTQFIAPANKNWASWTETDYSVRFTPAGLSNCYPTLLLSQSDFDCSNAGQTITTTLTAIDYNGNSSTCTTDVTVVDNTPASLTCQNAVANINSDGVAEISETLILGEFIDNCGTGVTYNVVEDSLYCSDIGVNIVTLVATLPDGTQLSCTSQVTVQDNLAPTALCSDFAVSLNSSGFATIVNSNINNGSTDNCVQVSVQLDNYSFDCSNVGANTVTLTASDPYNNSSTCTSTVTVTDDISPQALCQDHTVFLDSNGAGSINVNDIDNGSTDNCVNLTYSIDVNTFSCSDVGTNTVTLTVTDDSNNSSSCTSTVTVSDITNPSAVCQDLTVYLDASGNATITASQLDGGSLDACGIGLLSIDPSDESFTCSDVGLSSVLLTVEDSNGNQSTCTSTVNVVDDTNPVALCQDLILDLDATGSASITATQIDNGSNDACGIASLAVNPSNFGIGDVGPNTVTLTVTDNNSNSSTCTATVTIQDSSDPVAVCQDISVSLDASGSVTITPAQIDNGSFDASGIAVYLLDVSTFTCSDVGPNPVTLTIFDNNGNQASCDATVTVVDDSPPIIICNNLTLQLDASGSANITTSDIDGGSTDNCGILSSSINITSFGCSNVGVNTVILTVADVNGNVTTCNSSVTIQDILSPNALCQDLTVQLDNSGSASITASEVNNGSNDNCSILATSIDLTSFDCSNVGSNTVNLTVTDVNGNISSCTSNVTVQDNILPVANCQDQTVILDGSGNGSITVDDVNNGSNDNCGIQSTSVDINTFGCTNIGANTVTLTVIDVNGNTATCTSTITVIDNTNPVANCQDAVVQLDANGVGGLSASDIDAGGSDACGIQSSTIPVSDQSWDCNDVGIIHSVVLTITDANGNTATCTSSVTVEDNVAPIALCNDITVELDVNGNGSITANDINNGSSDACGISSATIDSADETYGCSDVGANTVTLTVTDVNGNISECSGTVTVEDNIAPEMLCTDVTIELDENGLASIVTADIDAGSSDACGIASISLGPDDFDYDCSEVGANTVTLTATDNNGNTSSCNGTVTVQDNILPEILCSDLLIDLDPGLCGQIIQYTIETSDNCAVATEELISGPASETYLDYHDSPWEVEWQVTDVNGNSNNCSFTVTMNEYADPTSTLVCIDLVQVALDDTGCGTIGADMILEGGPYGCYDDYIVSVDSSDAVVCCSDIGGILSVTVTDPDTGNLCLGSIEVVDELGPTCLSVSDYTIDCTASLPSSNNTGHPYYPSFSDNCGAVQIALASESTIDDDICSDPGMQIERIWTALDASGNPSQDDCIQIITIERVDVFFGGDATFLCDQFDTADLHPDFTGYPTAVNSAPCMYDPSYSDQILAACGGLEKIVRTWTILDWCTGELILLDANGNDNVQLLEIIDNQAPTFAAASFELNADATSCGSTGYLELPAVTDNCTGLDSVQMFIVDYGELEYNYDSNGNLLGGTIPSPGIELGTHELLVVAVDGCGNSSQASYSVTIIDEQAPTPVCHEILQVSVTSDGTIPVFAISFDDGSHDNCCISDLQVRKMSDPAYNDYVVFDCSEVGQTIGVIMEVTDCYDNTNTCMINVDVADNTAPTMTVPGNTTITCDQYFSQIAPFLDSGNGSILDGLFGTATYDDNCSATLDYSYSYNVDDCGDGNIIRFWTVDDPSGNGPITDVQVITVYHVSNWFVTFPADQTVTCANGELPDSGSPTVYFDNCENIIVGHVDTYYDVVPDACYKIVREWSAINWCTYPDEGAETGTQVIKVIDTEAPIFDVEDFTVEITESDCDVAVSLPTPDVTDCSDEITITTDSDLPNGQAGPGEYTVTYTVSDGCGNYSYDQITVTVVDTKKPTPYLTDNLVVEIMQTGMTQPIDVNDFDIGSFDNCSDVTLSYSPDISDTEAQFTCDDLGDNLLEIWVTDAYGNQDYATVTLTIQDNMDACTQSPLTVAGTLITENGEYIEGALVDVNAGEYEQTTQADGYFNFELPYGGDYSIAPSLDEDVSNGVSTFDMVLITQHILGMNDLDTPYQLIAADANRSNTITTLDLVAIRMVILQMNTSFPNNTSWRFVDASHVFTDPTNPWDFPEVVNYNNIDIDYPNTDFIGVKIGDVNGSVQANFNAPAESRTGSTIYLDTEDKSVVAGEELILVLRADAVVSGLQFTLEYEGLIFESLESALIQEEHIAIHDGKIAISWNESARTNLQGEDLIGIRFTAESDLNVSNSIWISSAVTKAEAYTDKGIEDIAINFNNSIAAQNILYQNTPNPFNGQTAIRFHLAESGKAVLTVTNVDGKVMERIDGDFAAGMNTIELSNLQKAGVYYYQLETEGFTATKKMLKL